VLNGGTGTASATTRGRLKLYDEAVRQALIVFWEASDRICGKRLEGAAVQAAGRRLFDRPRRRLLQRDLGGKPRSDVGSPGHEHNQYWQNQRQFNQAGAALVVR
jgi:hypothetical protein